jgi:hypothetical protein
MEHDCFRSVSEVGVMKMLAVEYVHHTSSSRMYSHVKDLYSVNEIIHRQYSWTILSKFLLLHY